MSVYKFIDERRKHLHMLGDSPLYGTSTVVGILNKPLAFWAAGMAVATLGWTATQSDPAMRLEVATVALRDIKDLTPESYLKRLDLAYKAHNEKKKDSATAGTDMHALLEEYVKSCVETNKGIPLAHSVGETEQVSAFVDYSLQNIEQFLFSEGHTYSEKHWLGGIVDAGAKMKNGNVALLDFKSSKEAYYSQVVQIAGYSIQIAEKGILSPTGAQILPPMEVQELIVVPFGTMPIQPFSATNVVGFQEAFIGCLQNYKLSKAFEDK